MTPRLTLLLFFLWIAVLAATPLFAANFVVRIAIIIAMFSSLAFSWNLIGGFTGYPSFATIAFFGVGSYVGAIAQRNGMPMPLAWLLATVIVTVFAALLGTILLRLRGHYFAIGSIAVVEIARLVISSWGSVTGGGDGLNVPLMQGSPVEIARFFLMVMLAIMSVAFIMNFVVDRHRFGFGLKCIRQNEDAAEMVGINTTLYKVVAFTLSAVLCGTVGAVYASWVGYIDPTESFQIVTTIKVPVMVLLGGAGTVLGPALGTAAFVLLEEIVWINFLNWNRAILGVVIVLLIFFLPGGLLKFSWRNLLRGRRDRKSKEVSA